MTETSTRQKMRISKYAKKIEERMITFVFSRGGSRVVQVICTNHSNFFQILFLSSLLLLTKSIILLVLLFIMKLIKQLRDYSVDHTANPAPPERSGRVTVRAVSSFVDLSRTTRKKIRRHDRTKFLPRGQGLEAWIFSQITQNPLRLVRITRIVLRTTQTRL